MFFQENRRCLIEAHHPDQVHAGGGRHGGNLLVVCQAHHRQFGDSIARSQISQALRDHAKGSEISFNPNTEDGVKLEGVVIEVPIVTSDETLSIFFANEHKMYWLDHK